MDQKKAFIDLVYNVIFSNPDFDTFNYSNAELNAAFEFFEKLRNQTLEIRPMTENGKKIYEWMQEHMNEMSNMFTSKEIAEALFISARSVAGSMRKLVNDGLVTKSGSNPIQYSLNPMTEESSVEN